MVRDIDVLSRPSPATPPNAGTRIPPGQMFAFGRLRNTGLRLDALAAQHLDVGMRIHSGRLLVALCVGLIVPAVGLALGVGCGGKTVVDGAAPGTGGAGGSSMTCAELTVAYLGQIALAKACSVELAVLQCTLQVDSDLGCPCPIYVNPTNTAAVSMLADLRAAWNAEGCVGVDCDAGLCPVPGGSTCMPQGPGSGPGVCTDMFTGE